MNKRTKIAQQLMLEIYSYTKAREVNNHEKCIHHLGRAHILSQNSWFRHFYIHFLMFEYSWRRKDYKEVRGQILRMIVTIPGHMLKKVPKGNTGWSSIGLNQVLPIPTDLESILK